jgi:alginate O-acetyltransferase complex protein AlgI
MTNVTTQQTVQANHRGWVSLLPAVAIGVVLIAAWQWPAWVFMWVLAFAIYAGFKGLTFWEAMAQGIAAPTSTRLLYLFCWPGMSFTEFVSAPPESERRNSLRVWLAPAAKTLAGAGLVWLAVPPIPAEAWLLRGWVGMVGIIMMLHFGTFHLLALALQAAGFNAQPNMRSPLLARSLADFWGNRWNTAFNVLADRYGFRPLTRRIGSRAALAVVFLASGLLHEAVITLPARGGYGLPTAYFALQAIGLFIERSALIRRRPWLKRLFVWLVLVVPLGWLFPPVFVRNVILPMLQAISAN